VRAILAFVRFCYDFVVGDDWRIALAVVAGLAITYGFSRAGVPAWWAMPVVIVIALPLSLLRAARGSR
jgi:hypothetical protein